MRESEPTGSAFVDSVECSVVSATDDKSPDDPVSQAATWRIPAILLVLLGVLVAHAFWYDFISDDSFILARYARNVVTGEGWVFNPGDHVEGYTSFAWVALIAVLGRVGVDYVVAMRGLSLVAALGCLWVLYLCAPGLGITRRRLRAFIAPGLLASSGAFACWSLGGLETTGYALSTLVTVYVVDKMGADKRMAAVGGVCVGICALIRPEGLGVGAVLFCWVAADRSGRSPARLAAYLGPVVMIVVAHLLWRRTYYGDWLPNTFYAKVGFTSDQLIRGLRYVSDSISANGGAAAWLVPVAAPWFVARNRLARIGSTVVITLVAMVVAVGGDGLAMHRFMVPVIPLWLMLIAWLYHVVIETLAAKRSGTTPLATRIVAITAVCGIAISLFVNPSDSVQYLLFEEHKTEVEDWRAVGEWVGEHASADAAVACVPIGAVGYYSNLRVYDMMGLTDRHIARRELELGSGWAGHEKHDGPYILSKKPQFLLLGNIQVLDFPLPPDHPNFVRPPNAAIQAREADMFTREMVEAYRPRVVKLPNDRYLHFMERRPADESGPTSEYQGR